MQLRLGIWINERYDHLDLTENHTVKLGYNTLLRIILISLFIKLSICGHELAFGTEK